MIITTTSASLHPENETRMFSVTVCDSPAQTAGVLRSLAARANSQEPRPPDFAPWHALQTWLELAGSRDVRIPFADNLAELTDTRAVRLRRDFGAVLNLICAHALLHQAQRMRDQGGRIIAALADYAAVYDLVIENVAQGVQAAVRRDDPRDRCGSQGTGPAGRSRDHGHSGCASAGDRQIGGVATGASSHRRRLSHQPGGA